MRASRIKKLRSEHRRFYVIYRHESFLKFQEFDCVECLEQCRYPTILAKDSKHAVERHLRRHRKRNEHLFETTISFAKYAVIPADGCFRNESITYYR